MNFEARSEFIAEYAKTSVKPINSFATDLSNSLPKQVGSDVNISTPSNVQFKLESSNDLYNQTLMDMMAGLHKDAREEF